MGTDVWGVVNVPLVEDRLALRVAAGYVNDPGFIDYNYIVREPGVSNPDPDFDDADDVAANLRKQEDVDTEETFTGRLGLFWQVTDAVDCQPDLLLPGPAGRRAHGQPRPGVRHGPLRVGEPLPRAERQDQPPAGARADVGSWLRRTDVGHGSLEVRVVRPARSDRLPDGPRLRLRGFPPVRGLRDRRPRRGDVQPGSCAWSPRARGKWNWIVGAFYNRYEGDGVAAEYTPRHSGMVRTARRDSPTWNTWPSPAARSRKWRCSARSDTS